MLATHNIDKDIDIDAAWTWNSIWNLRIVALFILYTSTFEQINFINADRIGVSISSIYSMFATLLGSRTDLRIPRTSLWIAGNKW
jgi:hypothetical protein